MYIPVLVLLFLFLPSFSTESCEKMQEEEDTKNFFTPTLIFRLQGYRVCLMLTKYFSLVLLFMTKLTNFEVSTFQKRKKSLEFLRGSNGLIN